MSRRSCARRRYFTFRSSSHDAVQEIPSPSFLPANAQVARTPEAIRVRHVVLGRHDGLHFQWVLHGWIVVVNRRPAAVEESVLPSTQDQSKGQVDLGGRLAHLLLRTTFALMVSYVLSSLDSYICP